MTSVLRYGGISTRAETGSLPETYFLALQTTTAPVREIRADALLGSHHFKGCRSFETPA
jgi:hypothetical protein